ncbi:MAG: LysR family transcriptional regulator [Oscillospiraceae bacterium]|nr:LysR family transcriptional regulator [Oscillospiraceae bacterium]
MNTFQLQCFISVAQTLNFREAAEQNFITQPAFSRKIAELEKELDSELLHRSHHKVILTKSGEKFYYRAKEILELEEKTKAEIADAARSESGHIRIAFLGTSSIGLAQLISRFTERHPQITLSIDLMNGNEINKALKERNYDFYFCSKNSVLNIRNMVTVQTETYPYCIYAHKNRVARIGPENFASLEGLPFAFFPAEIGSIMYNEVMKICHKRGFYPIIKNFYNCAEAVIISASADMGITILPQNILSNCSMYNIEIIPIPDEDASLRCVISWPEENSNPAADYFKAIVDEMYPHTCRRADA